MEVFCVRPEGKESRNDWVGVGSSDEQTSHPADGVERDIMHVGEATKNLIVKRLGGEGIDVDVVGY